MMLRGGSVVLTTRPTRLLTSTRPLRQPLLNQDARRTLKTVAEVVAPISIEDFRRDAFQAQKPLLIRSVTSEAPTTTPNLPALTKWFTTSPTTGKASLTPYLDNFHSTILQYELSSPSSAQFSEFISWLESSSHSASENENEETQSRLALSHLLKTYTTSPSSSEFLTLPLPLHLLLLAHQYNTSLPSSSLPLTNIYITQTPLPHLPLPLQADLPPPSLVTSTGRGDIYSSSIWLGLQPTFTPWHRDPNPNLFCQLCGTKTVRLMPPKRGEALFRRAMTLALSSGAGTGSGSGGMNSRMRGEEMMRGVQKRVLEEVVWGSGDTRDGMEGLEDVTEKMYEVEVRKGDMLFMPLGWWHSVKSVGEEGGINGSVNWWFR
ncbi:hypothetical protein B0T20DRAFT_125687 [Sordaria brevicollis]|uniref:JmjC domain-containing protein n=1 Tax=Sordaria brevicollis TaxID=83679 RepID=A0AAE0PL58_SORBR|nr:hypothetical protein B0T20DRAFT_125687 [Sordaria brevicollis]